MNVSRARRLLMAQRKSGPPLGDPPAELDAAALLAWRDIVAAAPPVLQHSDSLAVELTAHLLGVIRTGAQPLDPSTLRLAYRFLGDFFIPMRVRRRLIFGRDVVRSDGPKSE